MLLDFVVVEKKLVNLESKEKLSEAPFIPWKVITRSCNPTVPPYQLRTISLNGGSSRLWAAEDTFKVGNGEACVVGVDPGLSS